MSRYGGKSNPGLDSQALVGQPGDDNGQRSLEAVEHPNGETCRPAHKLSQVRGAYVPGPVRSDVDLLEYSGDKVRGGE